MAVIGVGVGVEFAFVVGVAFAVVVVTVLVSPLVCKSARACAFAAAAISFSHILVHSHGLRHYNSKGGEGGIRIKFSGRCRRGCRGSLSKHFPVTVIACKQCTKQVNATK